MIFEKNDFFSRVFQIIVFGSIIIELDSQNLERHQLAITAKNMLFDTLSKQNWLRAQKR